MTKAEAHTLLDAARAGADIPMREITEALRITGDVDDDEPLHMVRAIGTWERSNVSLFAPAGFFDGLER